MTGHVTSYYYNEPFLRVDQLIVNEVDFSIIKLSLLLLMIKKTDFKDYLTLWIIEYRISNFKPFEISYSINKSIIK